MSVDALMSRANPLVTALLRSPFHGLASAGLLLLSVTGRTSGRLHTFPVGFQQDGDTLWILVSEARRKQWWRNLRTPAPVGVRLRGRERHGTGALVPADDPAFFERAENALRRVPGLSRAFGVRYDRRHGLDDGQRAHLAREIALVRIELAAR